MMSVAIDEVNQVGLEYADRVEEPLWIEQLRRLCRRRRPQPARSPVLPAQSCWNAG